jgi:4-amino-4-deoxy-L-arabinose transferase-like glycosyltransferase
MKDLAAIILFLAASVVVRIWARNPNGLWLDEANTVLMSARPLGGILDALKHDGNPPLYYVLLHYWMVVFGDGEGSSRTLSVVLGAVLAPALYLTGRWLFGRAAGVVAASLALFWPLHVYYSQQVRMYSLVPVLGLGFLVALFAALDRGVRGTWRDRAVWGSWSLVVGAGITLIWTHNYGMFLVAASPFVWLLQGPRSAVAGRRLAIALIGIGLCDLVWLPTVLRQSVSAVGWWIAPAFRAVAPLHSFLLMGAGYHYPVAGPGLGGRSPVAPLSVVWFVVVLAGAVWAILRHRSTRSRAFALLAAALVSMAIPYGISLASRPIYLVGRYEVVAYPAFALFLGAGAETAWCLLSHRRRLAVLVLGSCIAGYLALAAATFSQYLKKPPYRIEERIAASLNTLASPGDVVITTGLARAPVEYYLQRLGWAGKLRIDSYPREVEQHLGWYDVEAVRQNAPGMEREAHDLVEGLRGFAGHVFLVDNNYFPEIYPLQAPIRRNLAAQSLSRQVLLQARLGGETVARYEVSVYRLSP